MLRVRSVLALLVALVTACASCAPQKVTQAPAASPPNFEDRVERALNSTVQVTRSNGDMVCAGTRVAYDKVLTAYHCVVAAVLDRQTLELIAALDPSLTHVEVQGVRDMPMGIIPRGGDSVITAHVLKWDARHDLALISIPASYGEIATIDPSALRAGAGVFVIGHPLGIEYAVTHGIVSDPAREDGDAAWTMVDATVHGGNSGGGLWSADGKLIGVCSAGYHSPRTGEALGLNLFAVPWALAAMMAA